jgi:hypothetical protein
MRLGLLRRINREGGIDEGGRGQQEANEPDHGSDRALGVGQREARPTPAASLRPLSASPRNERTSNRPCGLPPNVY